MLKILITLVNFNKLIKLQIINRNNLYKKKQIKIKIQI